MYFQYATSHIPTTSAFPNSNLCLLNSEQSLYPAVFPVPAPWSRKCLQGEHRDHIVSFLSGTRVLYYLLCKVWNNFYMFCTVFHCKRDVLYQLIYHVQKQKSTQKFLFIKLISLIEIGLFRFSIYFYASFDNSSFLCGICSSDFPSVSFSYVSVPDYASKSSVFICCCQNL